MAITTKRITMRQGTAAEWETNKTKMFAGEMAIVNDTEEVYFAPKDGRPKRLATEDDIEDLQIGVDRDAIKEAVNEYLEENPPSGVVEETDPTVPSWAKQPNKPAYTASEVGALPATTTIPTKTSQLTNDSNFVTKSVTDALSGQKADKEEIPTKTSQLRNDSNFVQKSVTDEISGRVTNNANAIVGMQKSIDDMTSLKAQGNTLEEQIAWLEENGDTTKEYLCIDGYYYACVYTEGKPLYKNWLPLATESDGKTIYNGKGYKDGLRLNSSGVEKDCAGMWVTGFMPIKYGDVIRIKGAGDTTSSYTMEICFYDSSKTFLAYAGTDKKVNFNNSALGGCSYDETSDTVIINTNAINNASKITNCNTFRVGFGDLSKAIITVNQEIVEGTTEGAYAWVNTGRTNASTNYEARISAIEKMIEDGDIGGSCEIANIEESTVDGGENVVTFSDGKTLVIKNGRQGSRGFDGEKGEDGTVQIEPLFAESVTWLNSNGDTSKLYILPDNDVYAYMNGKWTNTGNKFIDSSSSSVQKYLKDRNTYIAPVPSGYCDTKMTFTDFSTKVTETLKGESNLLAMIQKFRTLASNHPGYITETLLGKDASNTYDIYKYELEVPHSVRNNSSKVKKDKPVFIITAGLHGIEPDAVWEVYHFMQDICNNHIESEYLNYLRNNVKFVIVPISNPWGFVNGTYNNSHDVNLNKNFEHGFSYVGNTTGSQLNTGASAYSEAETVLLKGVFDEYSNAVFHLECHGKAGMDANCNDTIWFSLMESLGSELIEISANTVVNQIGCKLYKLGYNAEKTEGGYLTYYPLGGRPKDYTGTEYGMLSCTMEGSGRMGYAGHTTFTKDEQQINCEALENFILRVLDSLNSRVEI